MGWFWAEFDNSGMQYGIGTEKDKPNPYSLQVLLDNSPMTTSTVIFKNTNNQQGSVSFTTASDTGKIQNIEVKFISGTSYTNQTFNCQFVNY